MIILHDFRISLEEYADRGKKNNFPIFDQCPNCNCLASGNLHQTWLLLALCHNG